MMFSSTLWTKVAGLGFAWNEVTPHMPSLLGPIMSGAVLCFFRGAQVQKLQKLSLQLNVCHHEMLLMLKIHVSLQRETNACGQRNKRMYSAPTKKSCLSEKQSTGRDLFWANLLRLICKVLAHAKKSSQATLQFVIWPQRSPSSIDGPNWRILCQAVPKLKNTFFFLKIHLPLQKEAVFSSTNKKSSDSCIWFVAQEETSTVCSM